MADKMFSFGKNDLVYCQKVQKKKAMKWWLDLLHSPCGKVREKFSTEQPKKMQQKNFERKAPNED